MLVYSRQPHGGIVIDTIGIPGYLDPVPPARITYRQFRENYYDLRCAPYTPDNMRAIFGGEPPSFRFSYNEIRYLSFDQLVALCQYFKVTSPKKQSLHARRKAVREFLQQYG